MLNAPSGNMPCVPSTMQSSSASLTSPSRMPEDIGTWFSASWATPTDGSGDTRRPRTSWKAPPRRWNRACRESSSATSWALRTGTWTVWRDAKRAFEMQYDTARGLGLEQEMCRAIGNLGMVNYQLSHQCKDDGLLGLAIKQLAERVKNARRLKGEIEKRSGPNVRITHLDMLNTWETIGLARPSICHYARGNVQEAVRSALASLQMTENSPDTTVRAISRFFYGRALLLEGRRNEALGLFNTPGTCTPVIAFAKEPSEEHRGYLRELVGVSADMEIVDGHGHTALDHAVFNGDTETEAVVLDGLGKKGAANIAQRQAEARLRKGYRELF